MFSGDVARSVILSAAVLLAQVAPSCTATIGGTGAVPNALVISPSGSDSSPCTVASPCATITHISGLTNTSSPQTYYLRGNAGAYSFTAEQDISTVCTSGSRCTWTTYPGDARAVIRGNSSGSQMTQFGSMIRFASSGPAAFNKISNVTIDCGAWSAGSYATMTNTSPVACGSPLTIDATTTNNVITQSDLIGGRQAAWNDNGSFFTATYNFVGHNANDNNPANPGGWRTFTGNGGGGWPGATSYGGDHADIEHNFITQNYGEGCLCGGNTNTVQYNTFIDNFSSEVGCDGGTGTCTINANYIASTPASLTCQFGRWRFTACEPANGLDNGTEGGNAQTVIETNNIVVGSYESFSYFNNSTLTACYSNYIVAGNELVNPIGDPTGANFPENVNLNTNGASCGTQSGSIWRDNIAYISNGCQSGNGSCQTNIPSGTNTAFDHNVWFGGTGGVWAGGTGDLTSDPQLTGPISSLTALNWGSPNFALGATSPALAAGANILTYAPLDFLGNARVAGTNIGAIGP